MGVFERIAALTWEHPKKVLAGVALFMVVAAVFGGRVEHHLVPAGFSDDSSESEVAVDRLREGLGYDATPGIVVRVSPPSGEDLAIGAASIRREVRRITHDLRDVQFVARAQDPLAPLDEAIEKAGPGLTPEALKHIVRDFRRESPAVADNGSAVLITGHLDSEDPEEDGGAAAEEAKDTIASDRLDVGLAGFAVGFHEVEAQTRSDLQRAELIAFPVLALLLLLVFRGLVAAAVPLVVGVAAILGTFLALRVMALFTDASLFALNITTALSLGLAVDYALLLISRYREEMSDRGATREAHRQTVITAGRTVIFSGITVAAAMVALVLFPQRFLYSIGVAGAAVGILASTIALLGVSSLLAILGERIDKFSIRGGAAVSDTSSGWYRLAHGVMRRPVIVAVVSGAVMLALALPAISATLTGPSAEAVPPGQDSYAVQEAIDDAYDRSASEPITVVTAGAGDGDLRNLRAELRGVEGIDEVAPFDRVDEELAYANLGATRPALTALPQEAVREIRELSGNPEFGGAEILVSGNTARFVDQKESLTSNLPRVAGVAIVGTLILLFMLTGSVVLPLKTILMNALTLGAVLGIMTLVFDNGIGSSLLSYPGPDAIELITLSLVFAITFGLATDYAVLVLARIKEQHDLGLPNDEAIAIGIGRTGRVITAAAAMLAVVFLAFASSEIFFMKQAAIGQAVGVILDATIVRALLVPSLMALLGDLNWWAPGPLKRFQARYGFREA
jgi:uncharacterized membrane protein YdfJ with MMPL/SSD domain